MTDDPFALRIAGGSSLEDVLMRPLQGMQEDLLVVDVGARNGMVIAPGLARHAKLLGFEPNVAEFKKLNEHRTDAERAGLTPTTFKQEEYLDCALWSEDSIRTFFITTGTGACTLMGEARAPVVRRIWTEGSSMPFGDLHTTVLETAPVSCRRLDHVVPAGRIVDFLKLDVEGAELEVLRGASRMLGQGDVLAIKTEFACLPLYESHPLLGHQQVLLDDYGYRLIDLDLAHLGYTRDRSKISSLADRRLRYAGDAFFIVDPDRIALSAEKRHRLGIICVALGYRSLAMSLFRDAGFLAPAELDDVEAALCSTPLRRQLKSAWNEVPNSASRLMVRIARFLGGLKSRRNAG